nr:MAG TPA: hypothetical protein [Caudoviricetes sp.]
MQQLFFIYIHKFSIIFCAIIQNRCFKKTFF